MITRTEKPKITVMCAGDTKGKNLGEGVYVTVRRREPGRPSPEPWPFRIVDASQGLIELPSQSAGGTFDVMMAYDDAGLVEFSRRVKIPSYT